MRSVEFLAANLDLTLFCAVWRRDLGLRRHRYFYSKSTCIRFLPLDSRVSRGFCARAYGGHENLVDCVADCRMK
jgi:hypothetical protein